MQVNNFGAEMGVCLGRWPSLVYTAAHQLRSESLGFFIAYSFTFPKKLTHACSYGLDSKYYGGFDRLGHS